MRSKPIYIVDFVGEVVAKTQTAVLAELQAADASITGINYMYGGFKEITGTLTQMTQVNAPKYPLFYLYMPFEESKGSQVGIDDVTNVRIIIGMWSDPVQKANERYINNFKKILYPVYMEFLNQLSLDKRFASNGAALIPHRKTDWPYWGGDNPPEGANPFNDWVDVIEVKDLRLQTYLKNC